MKTREVDKMPKTENSFCVGVWVWGGATLKMGSFAAPVRVRWHLAGKTWKICFLFSLRLFFLFFHENENAGKIEKFDFWLTLNLFLENFWKIHKISQWKRKIFTFAKKISVSHGKIFDTPRTKEEENWMRDEKKIDKMNHHKKKSSNDNKNEIFVTLKTKIRIWRRKEEEEIESISWSRKRKVQSESKSSDGKEKRVAAASVLTLPASQTDVQYSAQNKTREKKIKIQWEINKK